MGYCQINTEYVGPYDFCNVENTNRLAKLNYQNGI